jgi:2-oxoglutarate ferredoxin oxidoreductase subunit delta
MPGIKIERNRCKGCELCVQYCPQQIIGMSKEINAKGYFFARVEDPGRCIGCLVCAVTCPDVAITINGNAVQYRLFDYFPDGSAGEPVKEASCPES